MILFPDSSVVAGLSYRPQQRTLDVLYRETGELYRYFEVPEEVYVAFVKAASKGTYLNHKFKPCNFRYERSDTVESAA